MRAIPESVGRWAIALAALALTVVLMRWGYLYWTYRTYRTADAPADVEFGADTTRARVLYSGNRFWDLGPDALDASEKQIEARLWLLEHGFLAQDTVHVDGKQYIRFRHLSAIY